MRGNSIVRLAIALILLGFDHTASIAESQSVAPGKLTVNSNRPQLNVGSQGEAVSELQAVLKLLGYFTGTVDGVYNNATAAAVSRFQQAAKLNPDGTVNQQTWERLLPAPPAAVRSPQNSTNLPLLELGMRGTAVTQLQRRLQALDLFKGATDGVFGTNTEAAVKAAQRRYRLDPDGVVGATTWNALLRQSVTKK